MYKLKQLSKFVLTNTFKKVVLLYTLLKILECLGLLESEWRVKSF